MNPAYGKGNSVSGACIAMVILDGSYISLVNSVIYLTMWTGIQSALGCGHLRSTMLADLRFALQQFAESIGLTFVALVNDVLFRSLPVKNSGDLVLFRKVHHS